jgi:hypothetical protein
MFDSFDGMMDWPSAEGDGGGGGVVGELDWGWRGGVLFLQF